MTELLHTLDPARPVTCGVNIFFNFLNHIGFGQYSDEKAKKEAEERARQVQEKAKIAEENAKLATIPSHNNEKSIRAAQIISSVIYLARIGKNKEEICIRQCKKI